MRTKSEKVTCFVVHSNYVASPQLLAASTPCRPIHTENAGTKHKTIHIWTTVGNAVKNPEATKGQVENIQTRRVRFELLKEVRNCLSSSVTSEMWEAKHQIEMEMYFRYFLMNYQVLV